MATFKRCLEGAESSALPDCDVDLADFAAFQVCFDPDLAAGISCLVVFEQVGWPVSRCGFIDLDDYSSSFQGYIADDSYCGGPTPHPFCCLSGENCCSEQMSGGGGGGESMASSGGGDAPLDSGVLAGDLPAAPEDVPPPALAWTVVESPIVVEFQPVGGGAPVTALAAGTAYEVHYSGGSHPAQGYSLFITGACDSECVVSASPAAAGVWSSTGLFEELALGEDGTADYLVFDDQPAGSADSSVVGPLCGISPLSVGELTLNLRMFLIDAEALVSHEMAGQVTVQVGAP